MSIRGSLLFGSLSSFGVYINSLRHFSGKKSCEIQIYPSFPDHLVIDVCAFTDGEVYKGVSLELLQSPNVEENLAKTSRPRARRYAIPLTDMTSSVCNDGIYLVTLRNILQPHWSFVGYDKISHRVLQFLNSFQIILQVAFWYNHTKTRYLFYYFVFTRICNICIYMHAQMTKYVICFSL